MKNRQLHVKSWLALSALTTCWLAGPASAHALPAQDNNQTVQDNDPTRQELARFDEFLDSHRDVAEQLRKDPSLVNNEEFVKNHPALQTYLQDHPRVRVEITQDPNGFMRREDRFDRREDDRSRDGREELTRFDQFLDSHREIAEQLRRDPSLVNNEEFVRNHPALQTYLRDHPELREQFKQDPNAFMRKEDRLDRREDDRGREELAHFDQFLDSHREIAGQLRRDPSLVNNEEFVKNHPSLQAYLQDHPGVREQIKQDPNVLRQLEARNDRREEGINRDRDRDPDHRQLASFGEFLGSHSNISEQLSKDPSLVKNEEYLENHPELKEYLNAHPDVRQGLMENPQSFVKSAQQFSNDGGRTVKPPASDSKPKP
jgi:hypothetical protein